MDAPDLSQWLDAARMKLTIAEGLIRAGRRDESQGIRLAAAYETARAYALAPASAEAGRLLCIVLHQLGYVKAAARAAHRPDPRPASPDVAVVVAVLDRPAGTHGIDGLLKDLAGFAGEVCVVFNDPAIGAALSSHPRINKWAILSANSGVARAWNIGLNLVQAEIAVIVNADLRLNPDILGLMARALRTLPDAGVVGLGGQVVDPQSLEPVAHFQPGAFDQVQRVDKVTGYCFALHMTRCLDAGIGFDPRLSPYFYEELDVMLKCRAAGLEVYALPHPPDWVSHEGGISTRDRPILFFGRTVDRARTIAVNAGRIADRFAAAMRRILAPHP